MKHNQTEHNKKQIGQEVDRWNRWRRDGREIESNTSRQSMIKKTAGTGS
jgi:hypothetical protein